MRGVDHHRQVQLLRQLKLGAVEPVLERRLLVIADLADGDDAVFRAKRGRISMTCSASSSLLASLEVSPAVQ
jgi:hypothetical protein